MNKLTNQKNLAVFATWFFMCLAGWCFDHEVGLGIAAVIIVLVQIWVA